MVKVNNCFLESYSISSSVPQGSILAPFLFFVFINDQSNVIKFSKYKLYADNLTIYKTVNNYHDAPELQYDLKSLMK